MDCDDVLLHLAARGPTLDGREQGGFDRHLESCESCRALTLEAATGELRPIARISDDAFDDPGSITLPVIEAFVFQIDKRIAAGGMGQVLRAFDKRLGREVALKEMLDPRDRPRFEREVAITARLQHPAIVPIYEAGAWPDGTAFYAMRLVDGGTLSHAIENATTFAERIALLPHVVAATEALGYAHSRRVIHRDLKPSNVLVGGFGETVVIDWGLAKELDRPDLEAPDAGPSAPHHDLTHAGTIMGTPCFMAPEQARGEPLDETADVYALGAMLYHLVSGSPPYWDTYSTEPQVILDITRLRPPTALADVAPDAPADLRAIIERAMARARSERYPTAREMAQELRRFEAGQLIARPYTFGELARRWIKKHRAAVAIATLAVVVLAVVAVVAFAEISSARTEAEEALVVAARDRDNANGQSAALLEEHGRTELLAGNGTRALVYLSAALELGRDTPSLRYLIAAASRELDLAIADLGKAAVVGFTPDGVVVTAAGTQLKRWRDRTVLETQTLPQPAHRAELDLSATRLFLGGSGPGVPADDVSYEDMLWKAGRKQWMFVVDRGYRDVVFDRAGKQLALVEQDVGETAAVIVVDETNARFKLELDGEGAYTAAFSDDGARLAVCGRAGTISVWDLASRKVIATAPSPDSKRCWRLGFVTSTRLAFERDSVVFLWELARTPRAIDRPTMWSSNLAIDPISRRFALGAHGGVVRMWSADGVQIGEVNDAQRPPASLAFTADGSALVGRSMESRVFIWDSVATLRLRRTIDVPNGFRFAIDPAGTRIATSSYEDEGHLWQLPRGPRVAHVASQASWVLGAHWLSVIALEPNKARVIVRSISTGEQVRTRDATGAASDIEKVLASITSIDQLDTALDARIDGDLKAVRGGLLETTDGHIRVRDPKTWAVRFEQELPRDGNAATVGNTLVMASGDRLRRWDLATKVEGAPISIPSRKFHSLALDPSGQFAFVFEYGDPGLRVVDLRAGTVVELTTSIAVETVGLGPRNTLAICGQGTVQLWDLGTRSVRYAVPGVHFAVSPDGTLLATGAGRGTVSIFDLQRGALLEQFQASTTLIRDVEFDAAGTRIAAQSVDSASLWMIDREAGSSAIVAKRAAAMPWKLVDGQLVSVK